MRNKRVELISESYKIPKDLSFVLIVYIRLLSLGRGLVILQGGIDLPQDFVSLFYES